MFSLKSFAAAMLGLYLAMRLGLPRPFWALVTAYTVAQPLSGAVRSKSIYRLLGTVCGSAVVLVIVPPLVNYAPLLTFTIAVWVGVCLYISLQDRTPRSYTFILAGYTAAILVFPALADTANFSPNTLFDAAVARVEEIGIGILSASVVHSLFLPQSVGPIVLGRMSQALKDVQAWLQCALKPEAPYFDHRKLAQNISELRAMSTHLPFDTSNVRWMGNAIRVLQDRIAALIPLLSAVEVRVRALVQHDPEFVRTALLPLLGDIAAWSRLEGTCLQEGARSLRQRITAGAPAIETEAQWRDLVHVALLHELGMLVDAYEDCSHLRQRIDAGIDACPLDKPRRLIRVPTRRLHTDQGLALMSALAAMAAIGAASTFWILSGWPTGFCAPMMAAIYCTFFATQDDPVPALKVAFLYTAYSTPVAALYLLVLLPSAHSIEMLMLVLAPFLIVFGIFIARPSTMLRAFPFGMTVCVTLTQFDMGVPDLTTFMNSQVSQLIGLGIAVLATRLLRSVNSTWTAERVLKAGWEELAKLALATKAPAATVISVQMVDRIGLIAPRLASGKQDSQHVVPILAGLRIGLNVGDMLRARSTLERNALPLQNMLTQLAEYFRAAKGQREESASRLLPLIDSTLRQLAKLSELPCQRGAIAALAAIRCDIFPDDHVLT